LAAGRCQEAGIADRSRHINTNWQLCINQQYRRNARRRDYTINFIRPFRRLDITCRSSGRYFCDLRSTPYSDVELHPGGRGNSVDRLGKTTDRSACMSRNRLRHFCDARLVAKAAEPSHRLALVANLNSSDALLVLYLLNNMINFGYLE
jgi:hypothetical protein